MSTHASRMPSVFNDIITARAILGTGFRSDTNDDIRFGGLYSTTTWTTTEAQQDMTIQFAFDIKRLAVDLQVMSKNEDPDITFRDDGSDVITVSISGSGITESVESTVAVAAGSICTFKIDTSASSSGSWTMRVMKLEFEPT